MGCIKNSLYFEKPQEGQALVISKSRWVSVKDEIWVISILVAHPTQNSEMTMVAELCRSLKNPFLAKHRKVGS